MSPRGSPLFKSPPTPGASRAIRASHSSQPTSPQQDPGPDDVMTPEPEELQSSVPLPLPITPSTIPSESMTEPLPPIPEPTIEPLPPIAPPTLPTANPLSFTSTPPALSEVESTLVASAPITVQPSPPIAMPTPEAAEGTGGAFVIPMSDEIGGSVPPVAVGAVEEGSGGSAVGGAAVGAAVGGGATSKQVLGKRKNATKPRPPASTKQLRPRPQATTSVEYVPLS